MESGLSYPLPQCHGLPGGSITSPGPWGQPPRLASLVPCSLWGAGTSFLPNTNEIFLLLSAQLGLGSALTHSAQ